MQARRGFTLIEATTIVVILGVLSVAGVASLSPTQSTRRLSAARALTSRLNAQRLEAMATGVGRWVVVSASESRCEFYVDSVNNPGWANAAPQSDPDRGGAWTLSFGSGEWNDVAIESVSVAGGGSTFGFDWMGRPVGPSGAVLASDVVVTFSGGATVTVRRSTGLASSP
jgi:Tfp pilus assembly protein FimT